LKDAFLKSKDLTQRTQRITERHREINLPLSAVCICSSPASPPCSLWLFSVPSVLNSWLLQAQTRAIISPSDHFNSPQF
jgi:hypothetical protein